MRTNGNIPICLLGQLMPPEWAGRSWAMAFRLVYSDGVFDLARLGLHIRGVAMEHFA